jgi:hypothetical protein
MFHFPSFPPNTLYIQVQVTGHISSRVTPFGNPRITARLPAPRGLSQAPTSFIGSWCQGIHRMPLQTYPQSLNSESCTEKLHRNKDARVHYTVLKQRTGPHHTPHPPRQTRAVYERQNPTPEETNPNPPTPESIRRYRPTPSGPNSVPRPTNPHTTRSTPTPKDQEY